MHFKFSDLSEATSFPMPREITPEEEAEIIAQYKSLRTEESLEADYMDFERQLADAIPAEQVLITLHEGG